MKKITLLFVVICMLFILTACSSELKTTGCRVIHQEDNYVTYQTVCDNCGYEYGDPATAHVSQKVMYTVTCTQCDEIIYVRLERG